MRKQMWLWIVASLLTLGMVHAENIKLTPDVTLDTQSFGRSKHKITFPAVKAPFGKIAVLKFNARVLTENFGGWNNLLDLKLNGKVIDRETAKGQHRLLRRGRELQTRHRAQQKRDWWRGVKNNRGLMVFFAPRGTEEMDKRIISARQEGYNYYIDVDDLINKVELGADFRVEKALDNNLEFNYTLGRRHSKGRNIQLNVKDIEIVFMTPAEADKVRPKSQKFVIKRAAHPAAAVLQSPDSVLEVTQTGGLQLKVKGETFFIDSQFSYPAKPKMKFNTLGAGRSARTWRPQVRKDGDKIIVTAAMGTTKVTREITFNGRRFEIKDTISNNSKSNFGLVFRELILSPVMDLRRSRLAGQSDANGLVKFFSTSNPSIYASGKNAGVGVVYEDNVTRAQLELKAANGIIYAGTSGCGIKANASLVREWAIYPLPDNNYYTLINAIRRDWNVNFTIPGPFAFSDRGKKYPGMPDKLFVVPPWFEFCHYGKNSDRDGALLTRDQYKAKVQPKIASIRAKMPDARIFALMETNLVPFDCRKYPWASKIKQREYDMSRGAPGIRYGQFLSRELTDELDKVTPLADSIIRDANGLAMFDNMYPTRPVINLMVQPEPGNYRFKQMLEQIDFLMNDVGVDSIYMDQFQPYLIGGFSENRWDGHTVELNPDGTIKKYRYSYAITGAPARAHLLKYVRSKGGLVLTNGQAMTKDEQNAGGLAFQEMENDPVNPLQYMDEKPPEFRWQTVSHLGCPVALGLRPRLYVNINKRPNRAAEVQTKGVITALRNGLLTYVYIYDIHLDNQPDSGSYELFRHMFPFTPVELNEGFLIGKERTITAVSGTYIIGGSKQPKLFHFNRRGVPTQKSVFTVKGQPGKWQVTVKLNDWNEVAIMVKQD